MRMILSKEEEMGLVGQFRDNGDNKAFAKLYKFYFDFVHNTAFRLLRDNDLASDITQETFIKVAQKISQLENSKNFKSWICTIARNLSLNYLRTCKRRRTTEKYSSYVIVDGETSKQIEERFVKMYRAIESLCASERELIIRKYHDREKISEISRKLNISESAVKMRLKRVKEKIGKAS